MNNIIEYVKWRGDIGFECSPINEVDMVLFSMFVVPDFSGIIPCGKDTVPLSKAVSEYFNDTGRTGNELGILEPKNTIPMIKLMGESRRFGEVRLCGYVIKVNEENNEQFGALCAILPDGTRCIIYKPTDDTIVGWKEDCMLAVSDCVPAQRDAVRYLVDMTAGDDSPIITVGQSKGGNLSVFAAINAPIEIQRRIVSAYNFDGPGFNRELSAIPGFDPIENRTVTVRPQHTTIGALMNAPGTIITIVSEVAGPAAHDPFVWEVMGAEFVRDPKGQSAASIRFEKAMDKTLGGMNMDERITFINELFELLTSGGAETLTDLKEFSFQKLVAARKLIKEDSSLKEFFNTLFEEFMTPDLKGIRLPFVHN